MIDSRDTRKSITHSPSVVSRSVILKTSRTSHPSSEPNYPMSMMTTSDAAWDQPPVPVATFGGYHGVRSPYRTNEPRAGGP